MLFVPIFPLEIQFADNKITLLLLFLWYYDLQYEEEKENTLEEENIAPKKRLKKCGILV